MVRRLPDDDDCGPAARWAPKRLEACPFRMSSDRAVLEVYALDEFSTELVMPS